MFCRVQSMLSSGNQGNLLQNPIQGCYGKKFSEKICLKNRKNPFFLPTLYKSKFQKPASPHEGVWENVWTMNVANEVRVLKFSPDGTLFATYGENDRLVKIWFPQGGICAVEIVENKSKLQSMVDSTFRSFIFNIQLQFVVLNGGERADICQGIQFQLLVEIKFI